MSRTARASCTGRARACTCWREDTDGDGYVLIEAYANDGTKSG